MELVGESPMWMLWRSATTPSRACVCLIYNINWIDTLNGNWKLVHFLQLVMLQVWEIGSCGHNLTYCHHNLTYCHDCVCRCIDRSERDFYSHAQSWRNSCFWLCDSCSLREGTCKYNWLQCAIWFVSLYIIYYIVCSISCAYIFSYIINSSILLSLDGYESCYIGRWKSTCIQRCYFLFWP